jgi:hypothetical protein
MWQTLRFNEGYTKAGLSSDLEVGAVLNYEKICIPLRIAISKFIVEIIYTVS